MGGASKQFNENLSSQKINVNSVSNLSNIFFIFIFSSFYIIVFCPSVFICLIFFFYLLYNIYYLIYFVYNILYYVINQIFIWLSSTVPTSRYSLPLVVFSLCFHQSNMKIDYTLNRLFSQRLHLHTFI